MNYTEIINSINKNELVRLDKFALSELVHDKTIQAFNLRTAALRKRIVEQEDTLNCLANQRNYDFYMGLWAGFNLIADEKDQLKKALEPDKDVNNQPMWIEELMQRVNQ